MARQKSEIADVLTLADSLEPRLASAVVKGMQRLQSDISISDLGAMIAHGGGQNVVTSAMVEKVLSPAKTIAKDAVMRGRVLGRKKLQEALR